MRREPQPPPQNRFHPLLGCSRVLIGAAPGGFPFEIAGQFRLVSRLTEASFAARGTTPDRAEVLACHEISPVSALAPRASRPRRFRVDAGDRPELLI